MLDIRGGNMGKKKGKLKIWLVGGGGTEGSAELGSFGRVKLVPVVERVRWKRAEANLSGKWGRSRDRRR